MTSSILWLGPFFSQINLLTRQRFLIISLLWFAYDILFVWLTPLFAVINQSTAAAGLPLAIILGDSFIGVTDFLWAGLLISLLTKIKWQLITIFALIGSNLILGWYTYATGNLNSFPLLVLWVPIGIGVLLTTKN